MLKSLTVYITTTCGKFQNRWEYQITLSVSWETCMQVKKQQLEPVMEQQTGSKLGKEYIKAVYCQPVYLSFDISPGNLDSSLWFIQPGILLDVLCILVKKTGWQYTALSYCTELLYIIYRLGLLWCWMICLGNKLRSLCCFWVYTRVLHFGLLLTMKATLFF